MFKITAHERVNIRGNKKFYLMIETDKSEDTVIVSIEESKKKAIDELIRKDKTVVGGLAYGMDS